MGRARCARRPKPKVRSRSVGRAHAASTPSASAATAASQARLADAGGPLEHGDATAPALRADDECGRGVQQARAFQKLGATPHQEPEGGIVPRLDKQPAGPRVAPWSVLVIRCACSVRAEPRSPAGVGEDDAILGERGVSSSAASRMTRRAITDR
jgi:hypothetical protein